MLYLLPALLLLIAPLAMTVFYRRWPRLAIFWLGLILIALISWSLLLLAGFRLPLEYQMASWPTAEALPLSPALIIDAVSWPYAMGLVTLLLAILITDVVRTYILESEDTPHLQVSWNSWVICTIAAGFALLAILANNPVTLILAWAVLDTLELSHRLVRRQNDRDAQHAVLVFITRVAGILFTILALISMSAQGLPLEYSSLTPAAVFWLFLAAGIHLCIIPFNISTPRPRLFPVNLEFAYVFFPAASALVLLARLATTPVPPPFQAVLIVCILIAGLFSGVKWLTAENHMSGQTAWVGAAASLAMVSALVMQPAASQAWGLGLLLFGGMLALYTAHHRVLRIALSIMLIGLTALPLTLTWSGVLIYHPPDATPYGLWIVILTIILAPIIQFLLLASSARLLVNSQPKNYPLERWIWLIYGWGLVIIPLVGLLIAWWGGLWTAVMGAGLTIVEYLAPGLIVTLSFGLTYYLTWRGRSIPPGVRSTVARISDASWILIFTRSMFRFVTRTSATIDQVLEGSGGILWTLLLIALLASIITQVFLQVNP